MDKPGEKYLKQHQRIARGDPDPFDTSGFGVESLSSHSAGGPAKGSDNATMHDSKRNAPIEGNQANPDHGPHR